MTTQLQSTFLFFAVILSMVILPSSLSADEKKDQAALVGAELSTIANHLSLRPKTVLDFTKASGQYCYFMGWDSHHTHYAIDPGSTQEDTIDFVDARPLLKAGVKFDGLSRLPQKLGNMTPNQWYFLPAGEFDSHHGTKWDLPFLVRASDIL